MANSDDGLETWVAGVTAGLASGAAAPVAATYAMASAVANRGQQFYGELIAGDGKSTWSDMAADSAHAVRSSIQGADFWGSDVLGEVAGAAT
jgi:hypothetical protein